MQIYTELLTERLRLCPIRLDDFKDLQAIWRDPQVARYLPGSEPYSPEMVKQELDTMLAHWQEHKLGIFVVRWRGQTRMLGYCGIQKLHSGSGGVSDEALARWSDEYEIIYGLDQSAWGQGIAGEAAQACLRYAFEITGLPRVTAGIHPDNYASRFILTRKLGMQQNPALNFYGQCPHFSIERQDHSPSDEPLLNLSTDHARLDIQVIIKFMAQAYWAQGRRRETINRSIQNSINFGVYDRQKQIGFARLVSDCATFAWLCDVFIDQAYRGQGLGKWLVSATLTHPDLQGLRRWLLATRDAHGLYERFGYRALQAPERWMEKLEDEMTKIGQGAASPS